MIYEKKNRIALSMAMIALTAFYVGCVYPYEPSKIAEMENLLVVEGDIIANDTTVIMLTRSEKISAESGSVLYECRANVKVEGSGGDEYIAFESSPGIYKIATTHLDLNQEYRVHITTGDYKVYASEFVPVITSPPIDSLHYVVDKEKRSVTVYLATHNPENNTRYYRWTCEQDWEIVSHYPSFLTYDISTGLYAERPNEQNIYFCWNRETLRDIVIDNTLKLTDDVVFDKELFTIFEGDQRISYLYCIRAVQRGLSEKAYLYWYNMNKINDMAGIFAPMPTEHNGNIHCLSNSDIPVLGYINATTVTCSERLYIPAPFLLHTDWECVDNKEIIAERNTTRANWIAQYMLPVMYDWPEPPRTVIWANKSCVDCRYHGTKNRPSFWPNDHL